MRGTSTGSFLFSHETDELTWTDGSALHPGVRQLSRAGWGLWIPGVEGGELAEPLGTVQMAQRAEVRAFCGGAGGHGGGSPSLDR